MTLQIAATRDSELAAAGSVSSHGARHDADALAASGPADVLTSYPTVADLSDVRRRGNRRPSCTKDFRHRSQHRSGRVQPLAGQGLRRRRTCNAHLNTRRPLSEEGGLYRAALKKYPSLIEAVIGLSSIGPDNESRDVPSLA